MWTRHRIFEEHRPYFVTVVCHRRRKIFKERRWAQLFVDCLVSKRDALGFYLYEYVVMPDHYHLIIQSAPKFRYSDAMRHINGLFAKRFRDLTKEKGPVCLREFYDHAIRDEVDYRIKARYIHLNPVRAGMVVQPEEYTFSSARTRIANDHSIIEVDSIIM